MRLNEISDNQGATKDRKRVGRGAGSGTGKTSGRGHKGQKSRAGATINGFEGGQMPIYRRLPKRGFKNPFRKQYRIVNIDDIQKAVDAGKVKAGAELDAQSLQDFGIVGKGKSGIRVLGRGKINVAINLNVAGASKTAIMAVEKAGGKVTIG
ncbi:MAG: 50S ribosomal protein L15 [Pseudomonadota bacterium]|jgi:large subunit ribosomal protein L15|nr:50S ribosomal protein L15 [Pseudomonadota bacterium]MEC7660626.1 50S ribosomal protein L15 [Pseudomonadota bacterium]GIR53592.1 MAG: 50S ribosomal protein L15 [Rhodospirillaceae bacterium]|tara:strand:- start:54 stop:509 length:456 start_codon:yes stop_codon:yes gene_type:complete